MYIAFTIIIYFIAFILGNAIACVPRVKVFRAILLPILSVACAGFIEFYAKELKDSELAQYAAIGVLCLFAFSRVILLGKKNLNMYSEHGYRVLVNTCYAISFTVIIFLMVVYSGYFSWLFGTTSKVLIVLSAASLIGLVFNNK